MENDNDELYNSWRKASPEERTKAYRALRNLGKEKEFVKKVKKNPLSEFNYNLKEREKQEKIGEFYTANLFLKEVDNYCNEKGISSRDIFVELKAKFLSDYRGFTGITNPLYVKNVEEDKLMKRRAEYTFQKMISNARQLIKQSR